MLAILIHIVYVKLSLYDNRETETLTTNDISQDDGSY